MALRGEDSSERELVLDGAPPGLVPVVFARTRSEADRYRALLEAAGVWPRVDPSCDDEIVAEEVQIGSPVYTVSVAASLHDRASEVIADAEAASFEDDEFEEEEEEDEDDDLDDDDYLDDDEDEEEDEDEDMD